MIYLTRLDGTRFVLNSEIIELIEEKPYTIITTTSGKKYIVKEEAKEIIEKATKSESYTEALNVLLQYVDPIKEINENEFDDIENEEDEYDE